MTNEKNRSRVRIIPLAHHDGLPPPRLAHPGDAGFDLRAAIPEGETWAIGPGDRRLVPSGLVIELPEGLELQVRSRSGLALKHGIFVLNAPGTVDSGYRGEIGVILANFGDAPFEVRRGDRIAQAVIAPVVTHLVVPPADAGVERGAGGFGHTGTA